MGKSICQDDLLREFEAIRGLNPSGTFITAQSEENSLKNRYWDVQCSDQTRVILPTDDGFASDYVNADFVDGYNQENAFIATQGPLQSTAVDFWRMIWSQKTQIIVMMTNVVENGRMKCHQYWEREESKQATYGHLLVITEKVELKENWTTSSLRIMNLKLNARPQTEETRNVSHFHFTNWADNESPTSTGSLLALIKEIRKQQIEMLNAVKESWNGDPRGPSIVVHCSAGIGRTGTFITVDISIARLEAEGKVDIRGTVEKLRNQRAYSVQAISQYSYCHRALIDYAIEEKFLESYKNFEDIFERNSSNVSYLTFFISS